MFIEEVKGSFIRSEVVLTLGVCAEQVHVLTQSVHSQQGFFVVVFVFVVVVFCFCFCCFSFNCVASNRL